jgi:hypothetical protein
MTPITPRDPAQNLILRTLIAPAAVLIAMLVLFAPALSHAAPASAVATFIDSAVDSGVQRVEVRVRPSGDGMRVDFVVKLAHDSDVPRLRAEFAGADGWQSSELTRVAPRQFKGSVELPARADVSFFLLGADGDGSINDVRYGTLFAPAHVAPPPARG